MKRLTILLFSILISFNSYSEWTSVSKTEAGATFYIDPDTVKERDGIVYYWVLGDFDKPDGDGDLSEKYMGMAECDLLRYKNESIAGYKGQMGTGTPKSWASPGWAYAPPNTATAHLIEFACAISKIDWEEIKLRID